VPVTLTVLYLNHTSRVSGGERSLIDLLRALPAHRVRPIVACPEGDLADRVRALGVRVLTIAGTEASLRFGPVSTPKAVTAMAIEAVRVRRLARRVSADLVHANSIRAGLVASACALLGGPPVVAHVRDRLPAGRASDAVLSVLARTCRVIVANSSYTMERVPAAGRAIRRVVHSPVDVDRFSSAPNRRRKVRQQLGVGDGPVLGVVGQLTPWKAQDDAIRITAALRDSAPAIRLLVVGAATFVGSETRYDNGTYAASLERLASDLGVTENVLFLGEREDVPQLLTAMDVLLMPSWEEPFGRVVIEAMAMGVPVVATSRGGPAEIIDDGVDGYLCAPRDPLAWAVKLADVLSRPAELSLVGARASDSVRHRFDSRVHAETVVSLYRSLA
jgi:L-malate glycosyltransferase